MAKLKGVNVTGTIVPYGDASTPDPYPVTDPVWGIGGWREVADVTARDAITAGRLRQGMIVYCVDGGDGSPAMFQYNGATWDTFAGGDGSVTSVTLASADGVTVAGTIPITSSGTVTVGLGDITPSSIAATGTVTGSNLSGTNTGDQTITLTGDVTGSGVGTFATTIAAGAISTTTLIDGTVTYPKIQAMTAHTLLGNPTGSSAVPEEISLGSGLGFSGTTLVATGSGGSVTSITAGSGLSGGTITTSGTIALSTIGNNSVLANISGSSAVPTSIAATALVDSAFGSAQGSVLYRGSSSWAALPPGTAGQVLTTHGASTNPTWSSTGGTVTSIATTDGITGGTITGAGTIGLAAIANHTVLANISGGSLAPSSTTLTALLDDAIGSTQGAVLYRDAAAWSILAPGTSGQFLATQGSGNSPHWASGGTGTVTSLSAGGGIVATPNPITVIGSISLAQVTTGTLLANLSGVNAVPTPHTLSDVLDSACGSTQGDVLYRSGSGWAALTPGTAGQVLTTQGASANPDWTSAGIVAIADQTVLANISGGSALPAATSVSDLLDACVSSTQGDVLYRSGSAWVALAPGTSGQLLTSGGSAANVSWTTVTPGTGTVTSVSVVTANGFAGTVATATTTPAITLTTSVTGILKGNGTAISAATAGTDYLTGNQTITLSGAVSGSGTTAITTTLATIPTLDLLANSTGGTAAPAGVSISAYLDAAVGSSAGVLARIGSGGWSLLTPTSGQIIQGTSISAGIVANTMSGDATITNAGVVSVSKIGGTAISLPLSVANGGTASAVGAPSVHSFGVSGTPNLNDVTPPIFLDRAVTCDGLTVACGTAPSGGSLTVTVQTSTDGTTWGSLASGAVSATTGAYSGTAACTTAISANTYVRGKFTAVNAAADAVCCLFVRS